MAFMTHSVHRPCRKRLCLPCLLRRVEAWRVAAHSIDRGLLHLAPACGDETRIRSSLRKLG
jgi:hypothetical protein